MPKPKKLAELLNMHAFEVEDLRKQKGDAIFDVAVLPNRAHDCLSHIGMAREISAITKGRLTLPKGKSLRAASGSLRPLKVRIEAAALVPRYSSLVMEGVQIKKSPKWVQDRLEAVGVNSINNVVDITNYVMLETGQPLHAFDYDQIRGGTMTVRTSRKGENVATLDDQTLSLPEGILVIEDRHGLIDLAGIKGGKATGISAETKHIVIHAVTYDASTIYGAKKALRYTTPAADLYAHGLDPNMTMPALERARELLSQAGAGGKPVQVIDHYTKKLLPARIPLKLSYAESLLGMKIPSHEAKRILESLDCKVEQEGDLLRVQAPTRRMDLRIAEDLVEEIGRLMGLDNIPSSFPVASLTPSLRNQELFWQDMMRDLLKTAGFTEVYNYSFIGEKSLSKIAFTESDKATLVELENPVSSDFKYLRSTLLDNLLSNAAENQKNAEQIRIFEIGKIFRRERGKATEALMLGGVLDGDSFYEAKGVVDSVCRGLGIAETWYDEYQQTPEKSRMGLWHMGKSAEIKVAGAEIGFVGEISKNVLSSLKIARPIAAFHIDAQALARLASEEKAYVPVSKYPSSIRDISLLLPKETKVVDIMNRVDAEGGALVEDIDLFDMYEGTGIPQDKKNLAFHITYRASDRTLTSKEVDEAHNKIVQTLEENPDWEVR